MEATIKAIHFDISEKLTSYINKKIDKLSRRFEAIKEADVTLTVIKPETAMNKEVSIRIKLPQSSDLFASKTANTFEEALSDCIEALEARLEKDKDNR